MKIPAISTIEFTNACNFSCSYCQRTNEDGIRKNGMLSVDLVKKMIYRGDFSNTVYTEFQQNGEPTLHPKFNELVDLIKTAVPYVGMSTNASFIDWKHNPIQGVRNMDTITISVHHETKQLDVANVLTALVGSKCKVRLQTLNNNWNNLNEDLFREIAASGSIYIDNYDIREWQTDYGKKNFCIDVKTSVTIQYDGDVVPCCNTVGKQKVLGNLHDSNLEDLWSKYDKQLFSYCSSCKTPSPYAKRLNFFCDTMNN